MRWLWVIYLLLCVGCAAQTSQNVITTLDERKIPACIRFDIVYLGEVPWVTGRATLSVYTAAGGADLTQCLALLRHTVPVLRE